MALTQDQVNQLLFSDNGVDTMLVKSTVQDRAAKRVEDSIETSLLINDGVNEIGKSLEAFKPVEITDNDGNPIEVFKSEHDRKQYELRYRMQQNLVKMGTAQTDHVTRLQKQSQR